MPRISTYGLIGLRRIGLRRIGLRHSTQIIDILTMYEHLGMSLGHNTQTRRQIIIPNRQLRTLRTAQEDLIGP